MSRLPIVQRVDDPEVLDLGWGHPDPALLPLERIRRAAERALERHGSDALEYGNVSGPGPLLEWLMARIEAREGRRPGPEELLITGGISAGLDLALGALTHPGETALIESPTYYLAIRILRDRGLDLVAAPMDEGGIQLGPLEEKIHQLKRAGRPPRVLYTVPTFNNPTGISLAAERRAALLELAHREDLTLLEDDVYRELAYDAPAPPSLWSLDSQGVVVRLGSFSKSLAPGLRLGWLSAPAKLVQGLVQGGLLDSSGGVNHFTALIVAALCSAGDFDPHVEGMRQAYRSRRDALVETLRAALPATCAFQVPGGGFFLWMALPPELDAFDVLTAAEAAGMSFFPGERFYTEGGGRNQLRLTFTLYPETQLREAAQRLAESIRVTGGAGGRA